MAAPKLLGPRLPSPKLLLASGALAGVILAANGAQASVAFYITQSMFDAAATTTLLEDFSTAPTKDAALPSLTLHGVTYTGFAGAPFPNVFVSSPGYTNYGAAVGTTTDFILTANGDEDIVASFSAAYTAVGFDAFFNGLGDGTLTVLGPGSTPLGSFTFGGGLDPATGLADKGYLGFTSTTPILGFHWETTLGGVLNTGFTDISVRAPVAIPTSGTPEPATWAMLLLGFAGLGALLRRRHGLRAAA